MRDVANNHVSAAVKYLVQEIELRSRYKLDSQTFGELLEYLQLQSKLVFDIYF